jgi:hypothetical protein
MALLHNKPWEGTSRLNGRASERLAAKTSLHKVYNNQIQTLMNYSVNPSGKEAHVLIYLETGLFQI